MKRLSGRLIAGTRGNPYLQGISTLLGGAALAHLVTFAAAPVLTRLYGPDAYGVAASLSAFYLLFAAVAAFRYDYAVVLPRSEREARVAFSLSFWLILITSSVLALGLAGAWSFSVGVRQHPAAPLLHFAPVLTLLAALTLLTHAWANRHRRYGALARARVVNAFVPPLVATLAYIAWGAEPVGLALGWVAAQLTGLALLGWLLAASGAPLPWPLPPVAAAGALLRVARRYRQFPVYNLARALLEQATTLGPVLVFAAVFSPTVAAWFALANNLLRVPTEMIAHAVAQVFFERAARLRAAPAELGRLVRRTLAGLTAVGLVLLLGSLLLAPLVFRVVFGPAWATAGHYAQLLSPVAAMAIMTYPISLIPALRNRQAPQLLLSGGLHTARVVGLSVGVIRGSPATAILLYSLADVALSMFYLWWLLRQVGVDLPSTSRPADGEGFTARAALPTALAQEQR